MRILLGPIWFVLDVAPENQIWGVGLCLVLLPCMFAWIVWPRWWSIAISVFAGLLWLILGMIGEGIDG
ncbi:MAG: hypothetical protein KY475_10930 [Planctomycetes bacterium]|nr:hypothetical protein [Planctomycetota bacterium]